MPRFRTALLAAIAIGAGIPAIASAQPGDRDRGDQRGDRGPGGQRSDQGQGQGRRFDGQGQPQGQPQQQQQAQPMQAPSQQQPQAYGGRPDGRGFDGGDRQGGQPDRRADEGQRGFAGGRDDRRPGFDQRQGFDPRQGFDQRQGYGQRPGFDRGPGFDPRQGYDARRGDPRQGYAGNGDDRRFGYDRGRDGRGPGDRGVGGPQGRFGADWRNDRRYDWRGYREGHREIFRAGRYQPPRAYYNRGYRRFDVGFRLEPFFYASNYWIDDPYDYRLPPVWGSYRWVRYYDDVLLVDLSSGEVVDVIHDFFW